MTDEPKLDPLRRLRAHVAHLEAENRRLRGQEVPSAAAVRLREENGHLRRRLASLSGSAGRRDGGEHLTVQEVAQTLDMSTCEVLRTLRDSLPMGVDERGRTVVARRDLDAYLLAASQGRPTQRFL